MNPLNLPTNTDALPNSTSNTPEVLNKTNENELVTAVDKNTAANLQSDVYTKKVQVEVDKSEETPLNQASDDSETKLTKKQMSNMAQSLQSFVDSLNKSIEFSVDDELNRDVITVTDVLSGDVIRQIPSQEMLDLIKSLGRTTGILFDEDV